ncbi:MAG TPA: NAD(+) synthase [Halanaerobiales bacterium]|nr:NAD(+) synthase [Halanaerobiales bacterium]
MIDENLGKEIQEWMKKEVDKRDAEGVVVGLSGGIDSSLVAALCKEAFGDNLLGVLLPASGTVSKDIKYANKLAEEFDIETMTVNLEEVNNKIEETFHQIEINKAEREYCPQSKIPSSDPAEQNIQTRLRMLTLYYIAEKLNYVVMGTSNKSEILSGYYTLHGDEATDMRPLGDLTKTKVWKLSKQMEVPKEIINREPSGGLIGSDNDRDEKDLGIDYLTFDKIYEALENDKDLSKFDEDDVARTKELIEAAQDKEKTPTFQLN